MLIFSFFYMEDIFSSKKIELKKLTTSNHFLVIKQGMTDVTPYMIWVLLKNATFFKLFQTFFVIQYDNIIVINAVIIINYIETY